MPTDRSHLRTPPGSAGCRTALAAALLAGLLATALPAGAVTNSTATGAFEAVDRGVQVTPDWVLVALHLGHAAGGTYSNGYGSWTIAQTYTAPNPGDFPQNDLALLRLVPTAADVPYLMVSDTAVPDGPFSPLDVTIASTANTSGPRAYAHATVTEAAALADPDDDGPRGMVEVNWLLSWDAATYVQTGDSGGGLFLGRVADSGVLLGITSGQIVDDDDVPQGSVFVQPAAYRGWIDQTMAEDMADSQMILWVTAPVPEPGAAWLMAAGLGGLALRRRRA